MMLNRYGPWLDTNVVTPTGPATCRVAFDYWLEADRAGDADFVAESLVGSDLVQQEDVGLCEDVHAGLQSPAYDVGR